MAQPIFMTFRICIFLLFFCNCTQSPDVNQDNEAKSNQLIIRSGYFLDNNKWDSADIYIPKALKLDPKNYAAYNNRAILKFKLNFPPDSVVNDFRKSLEIKPDYDVALYSLANYYFEINDYINTIKSCNEFFLFRSNKELDSSISPAHIRNIKQTSEKWVRIINGIPVFRAKAYYDSIILAYNETQLPQQQFIDKVVHLTNDIRNYKPLKIANPELRQSLDSARKMAQLRFSKIKAITEIDSVINFKQTVLNYTATFISFYDKQCREYLSNVDKIKQVGLLIISNKVYPKLLEIKEAEKEYLRVKKEFKNKYDFAALEN